MFLNNLKYSRSNCVIFTWLQSRLKKCPTIKLRTMSDVIDTLDNYLDCRFAILNHWIWRWCM